MKIRNKRQRATIKLSVVALCISVLLAISLIVNLTGDHKVKNFRLSDQAEFYIVCFDGIKGYRVDNGVPLLVIQEDVEVVQKNMNPIVRQAELQNRYLVFSEDGWPSRKTEGVVSIDFQEGKVKYQKTTHSAYTSAGQTQDYYFAAVAGGDSFITVYTPELEETDFISLDPPLLLNDFQALEDHFWFTGSDVEATVDESGHSIFKNRLFRGFLQDGKFTFENVKELETNPDRQYWFGDTINQGDYLYCTCTGWRDLITQEKLRQGSIYRYNLIQEIGEFFPVEELGPTDMYEVGENLLALTHSPSAASRFGFTLFDTSIATSSFVDLDALGAIRNEEADERVRNQIMDIKRLNSEQLLILAENNILGYNLSTGLLDFQFVCGEEEGPAFHIWLTR